MHSWWHVGYAPHPCRLRSYAHKGSQIAVATSFHLTTGPQAPFIPSNCQPDPIKNWAPISYASSVLYDIVILILTLWKLRANRMPGSAVGKQIYWDSVAYFLATASANITVLVVQSLGTKHELLKPAIIPLSTVMTVRNCQGKSPTRLTILTQVTMAQRVFLNLKLLHQRQQRQAQGLSLSGESLPGNNTFISSRPFPRSERGFAADASDPSEAGRPLSSDGGYGAGYNNTYAFKPHGLVPFQDHELLHIKPETVGSPSTAATSIPLR